MYYWDSVGDFFNTADNERKREVYRKLLKYLNRKIPKEEERYNNLKTGCDMAFKIMKGTQKKEALAGELFKMYDNKFSIYQMDTTNLLTLQRGVAKW
jgi:phosphoenolpyruvate carboxylase